MPKKPADKSSALPILDFSVDAMKELKGVNVRGSLHDLIAKYSLFVEQTKGQKPDKSAVVDGILDYFFKKDGAFQKFLKGGVAAKPDGARSSSSAPAGQPS